MRSCSRRIRCWGSAGAPLPPPLSLLPSPISPRAQPLRSHCAAPAHVLCPRPCPMRMPHAHAMCRLLAKLAVPPRRWKRPKLPQLAAPPEERVRCAAAESPAAGRGGGWRGADGGQVSVEGAAIEHYAARGWPVRGVVRRAGRVRRAGAIATRRVHLRVQHAHAHVQAWAALRVRVGVRVRACTTFALRARAGGAALREWDLRCLLRASAVGGGHRTLGPH